MSGFTVGLRGLDRAIAETLVKECFQAGKRAVAVDSVAGRDPGVSDCRLDRLWACGNAPPGYRKDTGRADPERPGAGRQTRRNGPRSG